MLSETTAEMTMGQWEQFEAEIWKERGRAERQIYFVRWDGENTQENICETAMETIPHLLCPIKVNSNTTELIMHIPIIAS